MRSESRLINLAKAHDVLTRESWTGANLAEIVADTRQAACRRGKPLSHRRSGRAACAERRAGNRHGAARTRHQRRQIRSAFDRATATSSSSGGLKANGDDRRLILHWEESGGPKVVPPKRKGFGSRLIERALAAELGGEVRVRYEPSGVVCTIDAPIPAGQEDLEELGEPTAKQDGFW